MSQCQLCWCVRHSHQTLFCRHWSIHKVKERIVLMCTLDKIEFSLLYLRNYCVTWLMVRKSISCSESSTFLTELKNIPINYSSTVANSWVVVKEEFFISNLTLNFEYTFDKNQIKVTKKMRIQLNSKVQSLNREINSLLLLSNMYTYRYSSDFNPWKVSFETAVNSFLLRFLEISNRSR